MALNAVAKKWVQALRSGEYKQTRGELKSDRGGHCCLGVLCELAVKAKVIDGYSNTNGSLPTAVRKWAGLDTTWGDYHSKKGRRDLTRDNDTAKRSFKKIADIIESEPEGLFEKN